jgi:hypothetical protein
VKVQQFGQEILFQAMALINEWQRNLALDRVAVVPGRDTGCRRLQQARAKGSVDLDSEADDLLGQMGPGSWRMAGVWRGTG